MNPFKKLTIFIASALALGCSSNSIPKGVTPVTNFDAARYTGTWYEIARLDHSFERGVSRVTAEYTLNPDNTLTVTNKGYSDSKQKWRQATGKARFVSDTSTGHLKVSLFGPFYSDYIVFELDEKNYQYALVSGQGPDHTYLWLLARTPTISEPLKQQLIDKAKAAGFDTQKLIMPQQF
ncbi:lipocalin family protein [Hydromonas duriensis]|uniref:Outer membrane lipoprotein Blc n=1 Tax=Hydromonas duriensis TaxID=1527608 RepID=A0A4R6Y809_9BURK|nr:lipocalin family protein [Hydromonas duriensis]TDR31514.1 apolipoprotein D and lipocalin family protein [Hydromonas duriensis]